MSIYTRTGDDGTTAIFGGTRVLKCDELVDVYGSIDEVNSWMGLLITVHKSEEDKRLFSSIQEDLFLIGSTLAGSKMDLSPLSKRIIEMEQHIDAYEKNLPALSHFILPQGIQETAYVHITRSIVRRVERQVVAFFRKSHPQSSIKKIDQTYIISYLNRLSDLLFVIARGINKEAGVKEIIWTKHPQHKGQRKVV